MAEGRGNDAGLQAQDTEPRGDILALTPRCRAPRAPAKCLTNERAEAYWVALRQPLPPAGAPSGSLWSEGGCPAPSQGQLLPSVGTWAQSGPATLHARP